MGSFDIRFMPCFVDHGSIRCTKNSEEPENGVHTKDYVVELLRRRRISASRAAELLDVSTYRVQELAQEHGVDVSSELTDYD